MMMMEVTCNFLMGINAKFKVRGGTEGSTDDNLMYIYIKQRFEVHVHCQYRKGNVMVTRTESKNLIP